MPGKIKVKVLAGRNLPVMDRASDTTDAFVEIKFGSVTHKTDVCRKSLNPHWSSTEWYRFEVDESELQDEPLQLRLMDHDTYSANDAIGKVVISLAPLLAREANQAKNATGPSGGAVLSGWIPVFDTMHGIRGELNVIVKVELFTDFNKYKTSSCGVQFFHCPTIPPGYKATAIHGFVEELVVNDDPEYQWIDKIRTPRASNEARQVAFIKLSNQVQRLVGVKAAELGANAVVGYQQDFDLEGEAGVVARAIGTAVSITPPPSASQPISIPPCTQQQLRKYLDILATDNESITDLNQYFQSHQDELYKLLNILNPKTPALLDEPEAVEEEEKSILTRQSSVKSYTGSLSIYQDDYVSQKSLKHISEDQTDLNKLLKRNDDSDSDSTGPLQKMKKIKSKLFGSVRSRKSDKQDDSISLQSNSSDTSRISLSDIKNEFKKLKRLKKPKFRKAYANKQDEGIGMASILARSVIHAHTSLACIAETQDSEHSPSSTMRRTSESEPNINVSDEDKPKHGPSDNSAEHKLKTHKQKIPEIHTSLKNVSSDLEITTPRRKLSKSCPATPVTERNQNLLKPGDMSYYGSLSLSGDSSEVYSSSEEDDESSSQKTDTEKTVETTSSVVHSVLNNGVNPKFIAQMDRKLSILEGAAPILKESKSHGDLKEHDSLFKDLELTKSSPCINKDKKETQSTENISPNTSNTTIARDTSTSRSKPNSLKFKFHNPFTHKKVSKSISAPSSPVENRGTIYRSSKKIRDQISKLSNSNMIKSLSHYSLIPKKRHSDPKVTLSQPGSTTDVLSKIPSHETVLGSPFLSYADLISLDKESQDSQNHYSFKSEDLGHSKVTMYIGSEPVSRASLSGPPLKFDAHESDHYYKSFRKDKSALKSTGLVHTAMETILIDKVQSLLVPSSPDPNASKEQQFFDDIHQKLEKVEEAQNKFKQSNTKTSQNTTLKTSEENLRSEGLVHSAIETILMDKVQSLLNRRTPEPYGKYHKLNPTTDVHSTKSSSLNNLTETQTSDDHAVIYGRERSRSTEKKHDSLLQTAMKTILIEKVQSLIPATPDVINFENNQNPLDNVVSKHKKHTESSNSRRSSSSHHHHRDSLLQTAMETILIDKVQTLIPPLSEPVTPIEPIAPEIKVKSKNINEDDKHNADSLLSTPIEANHSNETLLPSKSKPFVSNDNDIFEPGFHKVTAEKIEENNKLSHAAAEDVATEEKSKLVIEENEQSIYKAAFQSASLDNTHSLNETTKENLKADTLNTIHVESRDGFETNDIESQTENAGQTLRKEKKLVRQDSVHSLQEMKNESQKMFKDISANVAVSCITHKKPFLQHFHPILSGSPLETIPSLPESSLDHTESLDVEGVERTCNCQPECQCHLCDSETNSASVCDNSHAACRFDRNEGETEKCDKEKGSPRNLHARHESYGGREPVLSSQPLQNSSLNSTSAPLGIHRRSSDSDLSVTPKGGSLNASVGNTGSGGGAILRPSMNTNNLEMLEYPFLTLTEYPPGFIVHIGGTVCARSVKLVDAGGESAARAAWWAELRTELRAHARALRCNAVIAYTESAAICEDVCVLSASGTAAVINLECDFTNEFETLTRGWLECWSLQSAASGGDRGSANSLPGFKRPYCQRVGSGSKLAMEEPEQDVCSVAHVPYSLGSGPYRAELSTCGGCRKARVPAVLLATCAKPCRLLSYAKAVTITAVAARVRRAPPGSEPGARDISDQLPFLEYELHKLLLAKLRMQGANALFCLQTQIAVGERCVMALASGTAVRIATLPPPTPPRIKASENDKDALDIQKALWDSFTANKTANGYDIAGSAEQISNGALPDLDLDEAPPSLDLCSDKDACVLELDEAEDIETARSLATRRMHMQVFTNSLKPAPLSPPYAFAQVWRARLVLSSQGSGASTAAERHVARALDGVTYKLRRLQPCALVAPKFRLELPEDEIQLVVSGAVIPLLDPNKPEHNLPELSQSPSVSPLPSHVGNGNHGNGTGDADDDIFTLDEEQLVKQAPPSEVGDDNKNVIANGPIPATVSLTSLSYVNGTKAARRICALRLLFVRETTAVRELGGLSGFLHTFTCEVMAIVRAYTSALGGNALTSFYITQLMLQDNAHKNQGQCLLSVGGDVVHVTY